jgi:hypothetical protein
MTWFFIDDLPDEAQAFADQLGTGPNRIQIQVKSPHEARNLLLVTKVAPQGVLMDVDLSAAAGEVGSGPGIAQDLRVKQKARDISEFPIVRFAAAANVAKNVQGDPGSDDLFDLKIQKEELRGGTAVVQRKLVGLEQLYGALSTYDPVAKPTLADLVGLTSPHLDLWCHQGLRDRVASALQITTHVAAGTFMRDFILPVGLLLDEDVLSYRLGIDRLASADTWKQLRDALPFRYGGVASDYFQRWWARGLEDWWLDTIKESRVLAALTIDQRVAALRVALGLELVPLVMPVGSAGDRPWRFCTISLEADPPRLIPVDPAEAVRVTPRADLPAWADPLCAALGPALQAKHDLRLNRSDLARLERKHR